MKPHELRQLFAMPLQAAVNAQALALHETLNFMREVGLEEDAVRSFKLKTERVVEEEVVDEAGKPALVPRTKKVELSIPLLALLPPPAMKLQEMNVEFGVEVVEPRSERFQLPGTALEAVSLAPTLAFLSPPEAKNPTTMRVKMKIVNEQPEGMARLGDVLADMLSGKESDEGAPPEKAGKEEKPGKSVIAPEIPPGIERIVKPLSKEVKGKEVEIEKLRGVGRTTAARLKSVNIRTAGELARIAEDRESLREVARRVGIPPGRLASLAKRAKLLTEGEK